MESVVAKLPLFLPGNNRNWEQVDGVLTITEDGEISIRLKKPEMAEALVDMAKRNILWQVSWDYRMPLNDLEKLNSQFAMEVPADEDNVREILNDVGSIWKTVDDILAEFKAAGILFRESK